MSSVCPTYRLSSAHRSMYTQKLIPPFPPVQTERRTRHFAAETKAERRGGTDARPSSPIDEELSLVAQSERTEQVRRPPLHRAGGLDLLLQREPFREVRIDEQRVAHHAERLAPR